MATIYEIYRARRDQMEREIGGAGDLTAASDALTGALDEMRRATIDALGDRRLAGQAARLFESAKWAAACMLAVSEADIRQVDRPVTALDRLSDWLPSIFCQALAVWMILLSQTFPALLAIAAAVLAARTAIAGKPERRRITAHPRLDAGQLMRRLDRLMRALDDALAQAQAEQASTSSATPLQFTEHLWSAVQMLYEAHATDDGDYALRALPQLHEALRAQGAVLVEYTDETAPYFELFPTQAAARTIRPAIVKEGVLLARGQAASPD